MKDPAPVETRQVHVFPRRTLLKNGARGTAGVVATLSIDPSRALAAGIPPERVKAWLAQAATATPAAMAAYTPAALTSDEFATVRAAVSRIIPADDLGPGAAEAGVHIYIDQALAGPDAASLPLYQAGIAALDAIAGSGGFAAADSARQDLALQFLETGEMPVTEAMPEATPIEATPGATPFAAANPQLFDAKDIPAGFFPTLIEHTRQGMFGDPVYGGNASFVGWDLIGYPGIKLLWTEQEQDLNVTVEPEHTSVEEYGGTGYE